MGALALDDAAAHAAARAAILLDDTVTRPLARNVCVGVGAAGALWKAKQVESVLLVLISSLKDSHHNPRFARFLPRIDHNEETVEAAGGRR